MIKQSVTCAHRASPEGRPHRPLNPVPTRISCHHLTGRGYWPPGPRHIRTPRSRLCTPKSSHRGTDVRARRHVRSSARALVARRHVRSSARALVGFIYTHVYRFPRTPVRSGMVSGVTEPLTYTPPFQNSATVIVHSLFFAYNT